MIIIGEDLEPSSLIADLTGAGVPKKDVQWIDYLRKGGGGAYRSASAVSGDIVSLMCAPMKRTALILDLSPELHSENVGWGLDVLAGVASQLASAMSAAQSMNWLLSQPTYLVVLHTKHLVKREMVEHKLNVKLSDVDYHTHAERSLWQKVELGAQRKRPILIYAYKIQDDPALVKLVTRWHQEKFGA